MTDKKSTKAVMANKLEKIRLKNAKVSGSKGSKNKKVKDIQYGTESI